ncbi:MAG TPA: ferritin-like domain-containing protein [Longimicrobiaceae bacterium]|nr:ferritin-like domain-containing protein [Longimicrobiaceae bacterium]
MAAATLVVAAGCEDDDDNITGPGGAVGIDLSNDVGVLNFAYALEQLEAAFYTQVASSFYAGVTADEKAMLTDIRDHEIGHREFFKAALKANAIAALEPDFSSIDFNDRASVLGTAKVFENTGVGAYNGAGPLLTNADYLTEAGKIVSVEARHAAAIQQALNGFVLIQPTEMRGFDLALTPTTVLSMVDPYIRTTITLQNAPA